MDLHTGNIVASMCSGASRLIVLGIVAHTHTYSTNVYMKCTNDVLRTEYLRKLYVRRMHVCVIPGLMRNSAPPISAFELHG